VIKATRLFLTALMLAVLPALAFAQKTTYDFDKDVNFASIHTYALKEGTPAGNPLIDKRLVDAIQSQLAAKGLKVDEANPDIWVVYHVSVDKKKELTGYTSGYGGYGGYGWRYGGGMTTTNMQVNEILVGTLIIDMASASAKALVWRGVGVKEIDTGAKPDKRDKNINKAVEKILKNYPPKAKS
jgi:Domain of unknown function (DUF4136)